MGVFEEAVVAALPGILRVIPKGPAAELGRWRSKGYGREGTQVQTALSEVGELLAERVLGALELTVDQLAVDIPDELVAGVRTPVGGGFGYASFGGREPETRRAVAFVEQVHPGATDLVVELVQRLRHLASVPDAPGDEQQIAAQHGATHLALAVVVATAVLRGLNTETSNATPAVVGTALGAAAVVLNSAPAPDTYAAAVLEKRRAEYRLPRSSSMHAPVTDHRIWLTEGTVPGPEDFAANGLVATTRSGVVIRTARADGQVSLSLHVLAEPPAETDLTGWDDVVEVSWTAPEGGARLCGATERFDGSRPWETPPWPGDYRVRVHAYGRDEDEERYLLAIWREELKPEIVHKRTDRLGHRLRGEPEPEFVVAPEAEYRWISSSGLCEAATVTIVTGSDAATVVTEFGGEEPVSIKGIVEKPAWERISQPQYGYEMWLMVLETDGVVLAVEDNGFQGADRDLITRLSANGRAASFYWNVNGRFEIHLAERGELLAAIAPERDPFPEAVADLAADFDFDDWRHRHAKALTVLARFTGRGFHEEDLTAMYAGDQAYRLG